MRNRLPWAPVYLSVQPSYVLLISLLFLLPLWEAASVVYHFPFPASHLATEHATISVVSLVTAAAWAHHCPSPAPRLHVLLLLHMEKKDLSPTDIPTI